MVGQAALLGLRHKNPPFSLYCMRRRAAGMTKPGKACVQYPGRGGGALWQRKKRHAGTPLPAASGAVFPMDLPLSGAGAHPGGVFGLVKLFQRQLCGGTVPAGGCLCLHPAPAAVCGPGADSHVDGQPGGDYHIYHKLGLAPAGHFPDSAGDRFIHAGIQRLQAVAGDPGGGNAAAQRDCKVRGGAGLFPYHFIECQPDEELFGGGAALWAGAGNGGGPDAAGTPPVRHVADSGDRRGADVCGRYRPEMVCAGGRWRGRGRGGGGGGNARPGALCGQPAGLLAGPLCRPPGRWPPDYPEPLRHRFRGCHRPGPGNSRQKHMFVPEPQNDFIFSIVCEELGFIGALAVVALFVLLLLRGIPWLSTPPTGSGDCWWWGLWCRWPCRPL